MLNKTQSYCCLLLVVYNYYRHVVHHKSHRRQSFKVIHCCRGACCAKFPQAVQSYPKYWGNFGQQFFSFYFMLKYMPFNCNLLNIYIQNKARDMTPSISLTMLHVRSSDTSKLNKCPKFPQLTVSSFIIEITWFMLFQLRLYSEKEFEIYTSIKLNMIFKITSGIEGLNTVQYDFICSKDKFSTTWVKSILMQTGIYWSHHGVFATVVWYNGRHMWHE